MEPLTVGCMWTLAVSVIYSQIDFARGDDCSRYLDTDIYCTNGCCGTYYDRYCCSSSSSDLSGGGIAGTVTSLVVLIGVGVAIYFCCCRRRRQTPIIHTAVAQPQGPSITVVSGQQPTVQPVPVYPQNPQYLQPAAQYSQPLLQNQPTTSDPPPPYQPTPPSPIPPHHQPTSPGPSVRFQKSPPSA